MVDPEHRQSSATLDDRVRSARDRLVADVAPRRPDVGRIRRRARRPIVAAAASLVFAAGVVVAWANDDNEVVTVAGPEPAERETVPGAVQFSDVEDAARRTQECIDGAGYNATEPGYDTDLRSFTFGVESPDNAAAGAIRQCVNEHYQPVSDLWLGATNQREQEREQAVEEAVLRCLAAAGFDVEGLTAEAVDRLEAEAPGVREDCLAEALSDSTGNSLPTTPAEAISPSGGDVPPLPEDSAVTTTVPSSVETSWGPLAVVEGPPTGRRAVIAGTLNITNECVTLTGPDGTETLLVWPSDGTGWSPDARTISYVAGEGRALLRHGDEVSFGGGGSSAGEDGRDGPAWVDSIANWESRPDPSCPMDSHWFVGALGEQR